MSTTTSITSLEKEHKDMDTHHSRDRTETGCHPVDERLKHRKKESMRKFWIFMLFCISQC
jgi:hypothetical protein